ncbi:PIR Superfamily Protein [Plasmodium ovale curtisi]|uniref:PIR Superfamily Protein n=1 Tax=Plasmodium ovale curtisi TaxID=864141 RepID=A0A1A8X380_PLAOA|nr:PIR Superfamily Protein [Plasmodium ovale curtisi]
MGSHIGGFFPSEKNYKNLKESIYYDSIFSYIEKQRHRDIVNWIGNLQRYLNVYIKSNESSWSDSVRPKRCSDFNYWLHLEIKHRKLGKNTDTFYSQIDTLIERVCTNLHEKYYSCAKDKYYLDKEGLDMKKELHDFCGNRDITVMNNCGKYKNIAYICSENENPLRINDKCTLYNSHATFHYFGYGKTVTFLEHRIGSIKNCKKKIEVLDEEAASYYTGILGDHPPTSPTLMNI